MKTNRNSSINLQELIKTFGLIANTSYLLLEIFQCVLMIPHGQIGFSSINSKIIVAISQLVGRIPRLFD